MLDGVTSVSKDIWSFFPRLQHMEVMAQASGHGYPHALETADRKAA